MDRSNRRNKRGQVYDIDNIKVNLISCDGVYGWRTNDVDVHYTTLFRQATTDCTFSDDFSGNIKIDVVKQAMFCNELNMLNTYDYIHPTLFLLSSAQNTLFLCAIIFSVDFCMS